MRSKTVSFVVALLIAIATYLVATNLLDASYILAIAIATATFLVAHGGTLAVQRPRSKRE